MPFLHALFKILSFHNTVYQLHVFHTPLNFLLTLLLLSPVNQACHTTFSLTNGQAIKVTNSQLVQATNQSQLNREYFYVVIA